MIQKYACRCLVPKSCVLVQLFNRPLSHCYLPKQSLYNWKIDKVVFENEGADCLLLTLSKHIMMLNKWIIWPLNAIMRFLFLVII